MHGYLRALRVRDFRRMFMGATVSSLGDGMSLVALSWIVVIRPNGTAQLGLLVGLYTAPVLVGGWLAGWLLDRFDRRYVIAADSTVRGIAFASLPVSALVNVHADWLVFVVAALYGLFKMIPLAGFPSVIPDLVPDDTLDAANALEGLSYGAAGILGPAAAGLLIPLIGPTNVVLFDALSYLTFAGAAVSVGRPFGPPAPPTSVRPRLADVVRLVVMDMPIASTTLAFMAFNVAEGMLMVTAPWLARERLGGAAALGVLLSTLSAGELLGAAAAGTRSLRRPLVGIGAVDLLAAAGFVVVLESFVTAGVAAGFLVIGFFSAPMTVWAQSMRMRRLPPPLRGRAFATLRTLMQGTPPIGAVIAAPLLAQNRFTVTGVVMTILVLVPAVVLVGLGLRIRERHLTSADPNQSR